jgi:UDP-N-acetylmuramoyl-L-alanyl-D-glutamate--2,6-diaminopimelate ligase
MGEVAERLSDVVVVTSDDVRMENQDEIYTNIVAGMKKRDKVIKENDRDMAIELAVKMAKKGDCVIAAGMGHETTQLIGTTEVSRSDRGAFEMAIRSMLR